MNSNHALSKLYPDEHAALMVDARRRAVVLRNEAIDDFWRGARAMLVAAWLGACRSAKRLGLALAKMLARTSHGTR